MRRDLSRPALITISFLLALTGAIFFFVFGRAAWAPLLIGVLLISAVCLLLHIVDSIFGERKSMAQQKNNDQKCI